MIASIFFMAFPKLARAGRAPRARMTSYPSQGACQLVKAGFSVARGGAAEAAAAYFLGNWWRIGQIIAPLR
jgi:hypothetical protein